MEIKVIVLIIVPFLVQLSKCGSLEEAELLPEEMISPGSELLGKSLPLQRRVGRNYIQPLVAAEEVQERDGYQGARQKAIGNQYYGKENSDSGVVQGEIGFFGRSGRKGSKDYSTDDGYHDNERTSHGDQSNSGFLDQSSGSKNLHDIGRTQQRTQNYGRNGQGAEHYGSKTGHRKGHHKSGFTNSYHKDETGNKSDYFDDANDEGEHQLVNVQDGFFNAQGGNKARVNFEDGAYNSNGQGKKGHYDEGRVYNDRNGQKGNYAHNRYYDDKLDYGRQKSGEVYSQKAQNGEEQQGGNHYVKNDEGYEKHHNNYLPLTVERNYYPVAEHVGVGGLHAGSEPAVYRRPEVQSPRYLPYNVPRPIPINYDGDQVAGRGFAVYADPHTAEQYYLPGSKVYYPTRVY